MRSSKLSGIPGGITFRPILITMKYSFYTYPAEEDARRREFSSGAVHENMCTNVKNKDGQCITEIVQWATGG